MKILLASHAFAPSVGGIETVSMLLAEGLTRRGVEVHVVTRTPAGPAAPALDFPVTRAPGSGELLRLTRWADVVVHSNISLPLAWPLLVIRRPWVVIHHTWLRRSDGTVGWQAALKRLAIRAAHSVSVSEAVAAHLPTPSLVLANPFDDAVHCPPANAAPRGPRIAFVGRLVSDKGADVAVRALAALPERHAEATLTLIGDGPERAALGQLAEELALTDRVHFTGALHAARLAETLQSHRAVVVPSLWAEPFGLVVLEALACGCEVIASRVGGLPEALGECGTLVERGDVAGFAAGLARVLDQPGPPPGFAVRVERHLARHRPGAVVDAYLELLQGLVPAGRT